MAYKLEKIDLHLKVLWKISRNETALKQNFIIHSNYGKSEVAPNIRYGETPELIEDCFADYQRDNVIKVHYPRSLKNALNNLLLLEKSCGDIKSYLKLNPRHKIQTSMSIPIMDPKNLKNYLADKVDFYFYKLKIADHDHLELLQELASLTDKPLRIDANEGFDSLDNYLFFENQIKDYNIELIEQPFKSSAIELYQKLKPISKFSIIADESVEDDFDGELFQTMFHGINVKLMKAGGIEHALFLLKKAKKYKLKTMLGCMIETSLGIHEAFLLNEYADFCDLDGHLFLKDDPYFGLLAVEKGYLKKEVI